MFRIGIAAVLLLASHVAKSAPAFEPRLSTSVTHTDNIARSTTQPQAETLLGVGVGAGVIRGGGRSLLSAQVDLLAYKYLDGFAADELLPRANIAASFDLVPERVRWVAEDLFGQIADRAYREISPGSRQNNNFFSTGPEFRQPLGARLRLDGALRYADTYYEDSAVDNRRATGQLAFEYELGDRRSASLNFYRSDTAFKDRSVGPDLRITTAFARYEATLRRISLALQAGLAESDNGRTTRREPMWLADAALSFGAYSTLSASWYRGFQDASDAFRFGETRLTARTDIDENVLAVADTYLGDQAALTLSIDRPKSGLRLAGRWARDEYQSATSANRERFGIGAEVRYALGSRTTARAFGGYDREKSVADGRSSLQSFGAEFEYRIGRLVGLSIAAEQFRQKDLRSDPDELRLSLELRYPVAGAVLDRNPGASRRRGSELYRRDQPAGRLSPDAPRSPATVPRPRI